MNETPKKILITGAAGFIGSHVTAGFLELGWHVRGIDDLSSGQQSNLDAIDHENFEFLEADIRNAEDCQKACEDVDFISHHAAIGSVVKSIEEPDLVYAVNVGGFQNILRAAENNNIQRVIYASSCAVYGDAGDHPANENTRSKPLSPYAEGKMQNEADAAQSNVSCIGFRYFNIYGPRQDPNGAYAAVLPKWKAAMASGETIQIFGDGKTVRDFCHVHDVVRANIMAATTDNDAALNQIYNIGSGHSTTLNDLFGILKTTQPAYSKDPSYKEFREGDIRVSRCDNRKAQELLGFAPKVNLIDGVHHV